MVLGQVLMVVPAFELGRGCVVTTVTCDARVMRDDRAGHHPVTVTMAQWLL